MIFDIWMVFCLDLLTFVDKITGMWGSFRTRGSSAHEEPKLRE